jgi:hypothetical protein
VSNKNVGQLYREKILNKNSRLRKNCPNTQIRNKIRISSSK